MAFADSPGSVEAGSDGRPDIAADDVRPRAKVRSYVRRGRLSALTHERIATLGPTRSVPGGRFNASVAFGRSAPTILEIGCGHGHAAIAYAAAFPEHDLLALDVHSPGIARMLADADEAGVANLRIEVADAVEFLEHRVEPSTFAGVHLFFPDPWPKKKHVKRRFINAKNLDLLDRVLEPGGYVHVATDQAFYAEHVRTVADAHPRWTASDIERPIWRPTNGFEAKGRAAGRDIHEVLLRRD